MDEKYSKEKWSNQSVNFKKHVYYNVKHWNKVNNNNNRMDNRTILVLTGTWYDGSWEESSLWSWFFCAQSKSVLLWRELDVEWGTRGNLFQRGEEHALREVLWLWNALERGAVQRSADGKAYRKEAELVRRKTANSKREPWDRMLNSGSNAEVLDAFRLRCYWRLG